MKIIPIRVTKAYRYKLTEHDLVLFCMFNGLTECYDDNKLLTDQVGWNAIINKMIELDDSIDGVHDGSSYYFNADTNTFGFSVVEKY